MRRLVLGAAVAALTGLLPDRAAAQPRDPQPNDGTVTIPLTVSPAALPKPLTRLYLYPDYRDSQPGNRVQGLLRTFMEQDNFFANKENVEKREKWREMPLADLPSDMREQAGIKVGIAYDDRPYTAFLGIADKAARFTRIEWNEWFDLRHDGVYMLLPEVQKLRALASAIVLRMRGEVKAGEFHRAVESAKTLFGMAQALEQHPTLIAGLVGGAIATMTLNVLEEMVQQPGCPNLYWALTDLPSPLLSLRTGLGGERVFLTAQFEPVLKADRPLTEPELARYLKYAEDITKFEEQKGPTPRQRYEAVARDPAKLAAARKRLIEFGTPKELAESMPPLQAALTDDIQQYDVQRDELFKWANLPYWEFTAGFKRSEADLKNSAHYVLGPTLLPAIGKVRAVVARLDQRVALLRAAEAVRLYAHSHNGELPPSLGAVGVPVPTDPVSGKSFTYEVKGGVVTVHGENPVAGSPAHARRYEIRIRK
ncbi:MAG: hypothetical protein U0871_09235 [Gemmataceae bacterium]